MRTKGQIIAIGGGGFGRNPNKPNIEQYILEQANVRRPKITFFPTASAEDQNYILNFYKAFSKLNCVPNDISLFKRTPNLNQTLEQSDIIYIGGGNTKSMLAVFKEWNLVKLLTKAYNSGKILAGVSAGAICWFQKGITDSWSDRLRVIDCMSILNGCCCPHYDGEKNRRPSVENFLKENIISSCLAIEDGSAVHFKDSKFHSAVSFYKNKNSFKVSIKNNELVEDKLQRVDIF